MTKNYQPLHHKYRPQNFNDLVGQDAIAAALKQALISNRIAPAYIFSGPRGTGKTSSARILARSLNCIINENPTTEPCGQCELCKNISLGTSLDVIEIDAASNTGVDNIRELIERSKFAPVQARWKVYVIDECHMLSTAAFNALLKTLEEPPAQVVFILATTDPQRVIPTILSRCQRFDFRRISESKLIRHLTMIANEEKIDIESQALHLIAQKAQGGLRDAESMLDQLSLLPQPITIDAVWDLIGLVPEKELLKLASSLGMGSPVQVLEKARDLLERGREPISVLQGLASILRDLVLQKAAPNRPELSGISNELNSELAEIANSLTMEKLLFWQTKIKGTEIQIKQSSQPRLWLEVILLSLLSESSDNLKTNDKTSERQSIIDKSIPTQSNNLEPQKPAEKNTVNTVIVQEKITQEIQNNEQRTDKPSKNSNLEELWQQILAKLELPSTRMLLSQQAKLIRVTHEKAFIGVAENWMGMVQSRISLLEEAIEKTLRSRRQIVLENYLEINNEQKTNKIFHETHEGNKSESKVPSKEITSDNEIYKEKANPTNDSETPKKSIAKNQIENKAQQFADFFNGEILDLEE